MRKISTATIVALIVFALAVTGNKAFAAESPSPSSAPEKRVLKFAADQWCPVTCDVQKDRAGKEGIGVDILRAIYEPLGYKVEYELLPWTRAIESAMTGKIDGIIGASHDDAPALMFPKGAFEKITDDFYVRTDSSIEFKDLSSLKGKKIGIIDGYSYSDEVMKLLETSRKKSGMVQVVSGDDAIEQNIRKLMAKRIDVMLETRLAADYTIEKMGVGDRVKFIGGNVDAGGVYVAFSTVPDDVKNLLSIYEEGLARLESDGSLKKIEAAYGVAKKSP